MTDIMAANNTIPESPRRSRLSFMTKDSSMSGDKAQKSLGTFGFSLASACNLNAMMSNSIKKYTDIPSSSVRKSISSHRTGSLYSGDADDMSESSSHSIRSFGGSGELNDSFCHDDNGASFRKTKKLEQSYPLRSCLKGARNEHILERSSSFSSLTALSLLKRVRVPKNKSSRKNKIYKIEPLFRYANELWWTRSEIEANRSSVTEYDEDEDLTTYLNAYQNARVEWAISESERRQSGKRSAQSVKSSHFQRRELSRSVYKGLTKGYQHGYIGLEKVCGFDSDLRRSRIHDYVMSVTLFYHTKLLQRSRYPNEVSKKEMSLSSYSRTLTAGDRFWAFIVGCTIAHSEDVECNSNTTDESDDDS